MSFVQVRSPANIAVIKYMGKLDAHLNVPANSSISMTLHELCSGVEIHWDPARDFGVEWDPHQAPSFKVERPWLASHWPESAIAKTRARMDRAIPKNGFWRIVSANTFPAGAGIASSASFYSALTLGIHAALQKHEPFETTKDLKEMALEAQSLSGSSCRSLVGPWVEWSSSGIRTLDSRLPDLVDRVVVVESGHKTVSSTEAHQRVLSSPLWNQRRAQVHSRAHLMRRAIETGSWDAFRSLAWEEFEEMHELFHTSVPPFSYQTAASREVLSWARERAQVAATMDAGANVHLLFDSARSAEMDAEIEKAFGPDHFLKDREGRGAEVIQCLP